MSREHPEDYSAPFRVKVTEDVRRRPRTRLNGERGYCLGQYKYPRRTERMPDSARDDKDNWLTYNPLILTDSGHYIWGIECYWTQTGQPKSVPSDVLQNSAALKSYLSKKVASARRS